MTWHHVGVGEIEFARATLDEAHRCFVENLRGVSLEEALDPAGGYRSILGIAKHAAAWSAVYHSYAFEPTPRHWDATDWPRGLRDRIDLDALANQEPGEPGAVAAGAFHPDRLELAVAAQPAQQGSVAGRRGWESGMAQEPAGAVEDGSVVEVLVGVDPADDGDG
jgi:hypothetical protein